jgi:hypothetical protein
MSASDGMKRFKNQKPTIPESIIDPKCTAPQNKVAKTIRTIYYQKSNLELSDFQDEG